MRLHPPCPRHVRGFTLLEVLIALVVLSVGLLGIAAMMNYSLKANDSAYMRTQAEILAYNIMDKMRANNSGALAGDYNIIIGQAASPPSGGCVGTSVTCTSSQLAQYDLNNWKQNLASGNNGLPCGDGSVTLASNSGVYEITVTIQWDDSRAQLGSGLTTTTGGSCANLQSPLVFSTTTAL